MRGHPAFLDWGRRGVIVLAFLITLINLGPSFVQRLELSRTNKLRDFYQDYASARNFLEGHPIYDDHARSIARYLGPKYLKTRNYQSFVTLNAHPPSSVLLIFPLAYGDYAKAFLYWNFISIGALIASLYLLARALEVPTSAWSIMLLITALLICNPLRKQIYQGQLSLLLLLLFVGIWTLERTGRSRAAGILIGIATAIKLFPGFLFLYYALQRRWRVVGWGLGSLFVVTDLTAIVLGPQIYSVYTSTVLPEVRSFRAWWPNASLLGYWSKLFDPVRPAISEGYHVVPLANCPTLARIGYLICIGIVVYATGRVAMRAKSLADRDCAFGLAIASMLLICPLTWDHYFLLLVIPAAINLSYRRGSSVVAAATLVTQGFLWLNPALFPGLLITLETKTSLIHTVTVFSLSTYALIAFYIATWIQARVQSSVTRRAGSAGIRAVRRPTIER